MAKTISFVPKTLSKKVERDNRTYKESQVKRILYAYARDHGDDRPANVVKREIDAIFNFDVKQKVK